MSVNNVPLLLEDQLTAFMYLVLIHQNPRINILLVEFLKTM